MDLQYFNQSPWIEAEKRLANQYGLKIFPAEGIVRALLIREIKTSDFKVDAIIAEFESDPAKVSEFCKRWYADCNNHVYGEEWDQEEGDQQNNSEPTKTIGISQGFMIGYTIYYLYAKYKPKLLSDYIKRRRIPHARKVTQDMLRIYEETIDKK